MTKRMHQSCSAIRHLHSLTCSYDLHWGCQEIFCCYGIRHFRAVWPHTFIQRRQAQDSVVASRGVEVERNLKKKHIKERAPTCPSNRRLGGPQSWSGRFGEDKKYFCPCRKSSDDSPVIPYTSHYIDYSIPTHLTAALYVTWARTEQIPAYNYAHCKHFTQGTRHKGFFSHIQIKTPSRAAM
jgi:hypothetical protein